MTFERNVLRALPYLPADKLGLSCQAVLGGGEVIRGALVRLRLKGYAVRVGYGKSARWHAVMRWQDCPPDTRGTSAASRANLRLGPPHGGRASHAATAVRQGQRCKAVPVAQYALEQALGWGCER